MGAFSPEGLQCAVWLGGELDTYQGLQCDVLFPNNASVNQFQSLGLPLSRSRIISPAEPQTPANRMLCSCLRVSEADIRTAIQSGVASVAALGDQLGCGTGCGSCVAELAALLSDYRVNNSMQCADASQSGSLGVEVGS